MEKEKNDNILTAYIQRLCSQIKNGVNKTKTDLSKAQEAGTALLYKFEYDLEDCVGKCL